MGEEGQDEDHLRPRLIVFLQSLDEKGVLGEMKPTKTKACVIVLISFVQLKSISVFLCVTESVVGMKRDANTMGSFKNSYNVMPCVGAKWGGWGHSATHWSVTCWFEYS